MFGITSPQRAFSGFSSPSWFLFLGVFAMTTAIAHTGLMYRLVLALVRRFPASFVGQTLALAGLFLTTIIPSFAGNVLGEKEVRSEIDWNFLISLGALICFGGILRQPMVLPFSEQHLPEHNPEHRGNLFSHNQARPLSWYHVVAVIAAILAAIPFWSWFGLIR